MNLSIKWIIFQFRRFYFIDVSPLSDRAGVIGLLLSMRLFSCLCRNHDVYLFVSTCMRL